MAGVFALDRALAPERAAALPVIAVRGEFALLPVAAVNGEHLCLSTRLSYKKPYRERRYL
jgi:hypothetical protein